MMRNVFRHHFEVYWPLVYSCVVTYGSVAAAPFTFTSAFFHVTRRRSIILTSPTLSNARKRALFLSATAADLTQSTYIISS